MNHLLLVGRLTKDPVLKKKDGKNMCSICIAVKRQYKNTQGIYESDFIYCTVWNIIAERVCEYCKCGDMIGIKGHVQSNNYTDKDDKQVYSYDIVAEQIAFLHSSRNPIDNEESLTQELDSEENSIDIE